MHAVVKMSGINLNKFQQPCAQMCDGKQWRSLSHRMCVRIFVRPYFTMLMLMWLTCWKNCLHFWFRDSRRKKPSNCWFVMRHKRLHMQIKSQTCEDLCVHTVDLSTLCMRAKNKDISAIRQKKWQQRCTSYSVRWLIDECDTNEIKIIRKVCMQVLTITNSFFDSFIQKIMWSSGENDDTRAIKFLVKHKITTNELLQSFFLFLLRQTLIFKSFSLRRYLDIVLW